jgi:glutamate carboxypeptidase
MKIITFLSLITLLSSPLSAQLNRVERKLESYIDANADEAITFLEKLVNINSGSLNAEGVRTVGEIFVDKFKSLGIEAEFTDGSAYNRAGHFIAGNEGGNGKKILLIGHLDTVFEPDSPFQTYEMLNDTIAKGPGIADMKGGDVIIWLVLAAFQDQGLLDDMNIKVIMTGDEELAGDPIDLARKELIDMAKWADVALGFENGDNNYKTANIARRSSSSWTLTVTGNAAHSSQIFKDYVGAGAIYEASRILTGWYEALATEEYLTFNPGMILGGTTVNHDASRDEGTAFGKGNVVAKDVTVTGDIRCISPEQLKRAQEKMLEIAGQNLPQTNTKLVFRDRYPPFAPTEGNKELLSQLSQVSQDLGYGPMEPVDPSNAGAADISFTSEYIDMGLDGLGLVGSGDHTINETGDLSKLSIQAKKAAILIYRLTR